MVRLFRKQERVTLKSQVLKEIKRAIQTGKLRPGDRIVESQLAEEMGISKFPVREAIRYLEKEGLVVTIPFKGTYVSEFDERDVDELYVVRGALEELAIRLCVSRIDEAKIKRLDAILAEMQRAADDHNFEKMVSADMRFHHTIFEYSGNRRLLQLWITLEDQIKSFIALEEYFYERPQELVETHYPVLEAIRKADSGLAQDAIRKHLSQGLEVLKKDLYKNSRDRQDRQRAGTRRGVKSSSPQTEQNHR